MCYLRMVGKRLRYSTEILLDGWQCGNYIWRRTCNKPVTVYAECSASYTRLHWYDFSFHLSNTTRLNAHSTLLAYFQCSFFYVLFYAVSSESYVGILSWRSIILQCLHVVVHSGASGGGKNRTQVSNRFHSIIKMTDYRLALTAHCSV